MKIYFFLSSLKFLCLSFHLLALRSSLFSVNEWLPLVTSGESGNGTCDGSIVGEGCVTWIDRVDGDSIIMEFGLDIELGDSIATE